jgi:hypothetical protein
MRPTADSQTLLAKLARARGRTLTWILIGGGASAAAAAVSCDQPKPFCIVTPAPFAVRLDEVSREGSCEGLGPEGFNADSVVGIAPFYKRDDKGQPDYHRGAIAMRTSEIGGLVGTAEGYGVESTGQLYSMGDFATELPDDDELCHVPTLSATRLELEELPAVEDDPATEDDDETFAGQPAQDITLEWSNVKIVVSAALFGSQVSGDLTDTRVTAAGTCTIKYKAIGLSPAVHCFKSDEEGNPVVKDDGTYDIDPDLCNSEADPAAGRFSGSGISPLSNTQCDAVTGYCLLRGDSVPDYKE